MELSLFHLWECSYSAKVRDFIERLGLQNQIEYRDVQEKRHHDELVRLTGETQVPCLVIDGRPLLESESIIHWLEDNRLQQSSTEGRSSDAATAHA